VVIILAVIIAIMIGVLMFIPAAQSPTTVPVFRPAISPDGTITVSAPVMNAVVTSPVMVAGSANGWYFEAVFPVKVLDGDGIVLGSGLAQAHGDWATTSSVTFSAIISFTAPKYATGTIVFQKDNPSGLSENDRSFSVPVYFLNNASKL